MLPLETLGSYSIVCDVGIRGERGSLSAARWISSSPYGTYGNFLFKLPSANFMSATEFQQHSTTPGSLEGRVHVSPFEIRPVVAAGNLPESLGMCRRPRAAAQYRGRNTEVSGKALGVRHACRCQRSPVSAKSESSHTREERRHAFLVLILELVAPCYGFKQKAVPVNFPTALGDEERHRVPRWPWLFKKRPPFIASALGMLGSLQGFLRLISNLVSQF